MAATPSATRSQWQPVGDEIGEGVLARLDQRPAGHEVGGVGAPDGDQGDLLVDHVTERVERHVAVIGVVSRLDVGATPAQHVESFRD